MARLNDTMLMDMCSDGLEKDHEVEIVNFADRMLNRCNEHGENAGKLREKDDADLMAGLLKNVAKIMASIVEGGEIDDCCADVGNYAMALGWQMRERSNGAEDADNLR